jgi:hypothetical protein
VARLVGRRSAQLRWRALVEGEVKQPGIWLAEQVVPQEWFFERLAARGLALRVESRLAD